MTNVYRDPRVMVGNWSEDRAEPLEGVLVDYGYRSYNTTSGDAFPVPSPGLTDRAIASKTFPFWDMLKVESVPRMPRRCILAALVIAASFGGDLLGTGKASPLVVL